MMNLLSTALLGLIVGLLARSLFPGTQKMGWILTIVLGVGGSVLANVAGQAMGWYQPGEVAGWFGSLVGALALLWLAGLVRGRSSS